MKPPKTLNEQLAEAAQAAIGKGETQAGIARAIDYHPKSLSRFLAGRMGLSEHLQGRLAAELGYEIVLRKIGKGR